MDELIVRLLARWREVGVAPNLGATEDELLAFQDTNHIQLPDDLRQVLQAVNGIPFSELDGLARLRPVAEFFRIVDRIPEASSKSNEPERYYCFGDYNIEGSF